MMFVKYGTYLFNTGKLHFQLVKCRIELYDKTILSPMFSLEFRNAQTASFAYGRIIHGLLNNWGCVDITQQAVIGILEKLEKKKSVQDGTSI